MHTSTAGDKSMTASFDQESCLASLHEVWGMLLISHHQNNPILHCLVIKSKCRPKPPPPSSPPPQTAKQKCVYPYSWILYIQSEQQRWVAMLGMHSLANQNSTTGEWQYEACIHCLIRTAPQVSGMLGMHSLPNQNSTTGEWNVGHAFTGQSEQHHR